MCGSNAAGEALPPHFQFQTKATTDGGERLRNDVSRHVPRVIGKFGHDEVKDFDVTFGLNTKGGMDDDEFRQYVVNSILPLYPNTRDKPGHRLLLKCDSATVGQGGCRSNCSPSCVTLVSISILVYQTQLR